MAKLPVDEIAQAISGAVTLVFKKYSDPSKTDECNRGSRTEEPSVSSDFGEFYVKRRKLNKGN